MYKSLMLVAVALLFSSCVENCKNPNLFENEFYKLAINKENGAIEAIEKNGKNMIVLDNAKAALFEINFLD